MNYTWAHFLNTQDSGNNGASGWIEQTMDPKADYGASEFDVRQAFKGRVVYQLPFGIGRQFLNTNHILDAVTVDGRLRPQCCFRPEAFHSDY